MNAIILAAGIGKRLRPWTEHNPKSLLSFGGRSLLSRHLTNLRAAGIEDITVVVGYMAEKILAEVEKTGFGAHVRFIFNEDFEKGSALSLLKAAPAFGRAETLIMDADILFGFPLLQRLISAPHSNCLLVDEKPLPADSEEVKVVVRKDGSVAELGKRVFLLGRILGESVGLFKFGPEAHVQLTALLSEMVEGDPHLEYEPVVNALLDRVRVGFATVTDLPWIEIDFPEDAAAAEAKILPRI